MFQFANPIAFLLLLLIPPVVWRSWRAQRRSTIRYSSQLCMKTIGPSWRARVLPLMPMLHALALALIVVAIARPQFGIGRVHTRADAVAAMIVVDRSWSMSEIMDEREGKSRIDVVKEVCEQFVLGNDDDLEGRPDDLIGLVTFGRFAETICPLVRIHDTLTQLVDHIELAHPQSLDAGTAIGEGLALAAARLQDAENDLAKRNETEAEPDLQIKSKIIILMTDGDENVGAISARQAAQLCSDWGIRIYAIGIGGGRGYTTIQTPLGEQRIPTGGFNTRLLREVAEQTDGKYWSAGDPEALRAVYREIDELEKTEIESREFTRYHEAFTPWAAMAAALLVLHALFGATIFRRIP